MRTQEAFTISILECARKINFKFNRTWINGEGLTEHIFHCPLRKDKNASIFINPTKNVAYDNGGIVDGEVLSGLLITHTDTPTSKILEMQ